MSSETRPDDLITLLPFNQQKKGRNVTLADLFSAFLTSSKLEVHGTDITLILQTEFNIEISNLKKEAINVISEAFFNYYKIWPGWDRKQEYLSGEILYSVWYRQFMEYLTYKCKAAIECIENYMKEMKKNIVTASSQTNQIGESKECPYKLIVGSLPIIINNIAFISREGHLFIKQHPTKPWNQLSVLEFLNWPYVSAELKLLDIHIKRDNTHKYERYVTADKIEFNIPDTNFITRVTKHSNIAHPYTYRYFSVYFTQLFKVLKQVKTLNLDFLTLLQIFCEQFLEDIKEMNIHGGSMQTNTSVSFHIGNFKYFRQKQIVTSPKDLTEKHQNIINFLEIITPEIVLTLNEFKAVQDLRSTNSVTFKSLNTINQMIVNSSELEMSNLLKDLYKSLTFCCTFCNVTYGGTNALKDITSHFSELHKVGHALMCYLCGKEFEVQRLSKQRWKHKCI